MLFIDKFFYSEWLFSSNEMELNLPKVCGMETGPNDKFNLDLWDASKGPLNSLGSIANVLKK